MGEERPSSPIPQYILKALATGKTKPGTPRPRRFHFADCISKSPTPSSAPSPSRTPVRSNTPNNIQTENEEAINPALSYRPRYHHNLNSPLTNLTEYFFAPAETEPDDDQNGTQTNEEEAQQEEVQAANDQVGDGNNTQQLECALICHPLSEQQEHPQEHEEEQAQVQVSRRLNLTFKRSTLLKRELGVLKTIGRDIFIEERKRLSLEVKFPEVVELAKNTWKKMRESMTLHEDLATGHVAFSRWNVDGTCPDPEIFDMLMAYGAIRAECEKMMKRQRTEVKSYPQNRFLRATDIVKRYAVTEKRIKCHAFNTLVFKLPIKLPATPWHPTTALSFFGNVAIRYDISTGYFMFSGLYHKVELKGMSAVKIAMFDFHVAQKVQSRGAVSAGVMRLKEW
ncbi:hypothetical protein TWF694_004921 [Orbilia ellipsospora]|uniref:Uncharacterized protein n=1 Tax=Orbilia ellipsospora TaxID=2528407 RepID=A0AAV9WUB3_9PEZI